MATASSRGGLLGWRTALAVAAVLLGAQRLELGLDPSYGNERLASGALQPHEEGQQHGGGAHNHGQDDQRYGVHPKHRTLAHGEPPAWW